MASQTSPDRRASHGADKTIAHSEANVASRITPDARSPGPKGPDANTASTRSTEMAASPEVRQSPGATTADQPSDINAGAPKSAVELPRDLASASQDRRMDQKETGSTSASQPPPSSVMADRQPQSKSADEPTNHPTENKAAAAPPKADNVSTEDSKAATSPDLSPAQPDATVADAKSTDTPSAQLTTGSISRATSPAIENQIEAATALAQKLTLADHNGDQQTDKASEIPAMVALVLARTEVTSLSDLAGKVVAVDGRHGASDHGVRPALLAAGASDIQIRESDDDAVAQLVEGQVPAVVLALASQDAADAFPAIAGYKLFQLPLSKPGAQDSAEPK